MSPGPGKAGTKMPRREQHTVGRTVISQSSRAKAIAHRLPRDAPEPGDRCSGRRRWPESVSGGYNQNVKKPFRVNKIIGFR